MATKSICKSINVKTRKECRDLLRALEMSKKSPQQEVKYQRGVGELTREQMIALFGDAK